MKRDRLASAGDAGSRAAPYAIREATVVRTTEELLYPLPPLLVRDSIFSYIAAPALLTTEDVTLVDFEASLQPLRGVCKAWESVSDSLAEEIKKTLQSVVISRGDDEEITKIQLEAEHNGANAAFLQVITAELREQDYVCYRGSHISEKSLSRVPWLSLMSKFQHVVRLDLSRTLWSQLLEILSIVSTVCPRVQALILPHRPVASEEGELEESVLVVALAEALGRWHRSNGGLRLLHVPYWPTDKRDHTNLMEAIITHCPRLKRLRGWHLGSDRLQVTALGNVRLDVWSDLWRRCPELREFNWRMAPMGGSFLEIFLAESRPCIEAIVIEEQRGRSNIKRGIETVVSILNVTPALRSLKLQMVDTLFFLLAENHSAYAGVIDTLGDAFASDLITKCPKLEQFHYVMRSPERMLTLTGVGLSTLVAVPSVMDLALTRVVFEVTSLSALVQTLSQTSSRRKHRRLTIALTAADAAHDSLLALIDFLATSPRAFADGLVVTLSVTREEMVRRTHPRGIRVKNLISEEELQRLVDGLTSTYAGTAFRLRLQVYSFGVGVPRHAIAEMRLQFNTKTPRDHLEASDDEGVCEIERIQVPRHRKRGGMIA